MYQNSVELQRGIACSAILFYPDGVVAVLVCLVHVVDWCSTQFLPGDVRLQVAMYIFLDPAFSPFLLYESDHLFGTVFILVLHAITSFIWGCHLCDCLA